MNLIMLILLEVIKALVKEIVTYSVKAFINVYKAWRHEKTTPKLRQGTRGGRSRKYRG